LANKTDFVKKSLIVAVAALVIGIVIVGAILVYQSPNKSATNSLSKVTITATDMQWNGQTYSVVPTAYTQNSGYNAVIITFGFKNDGQGFSPTQTFSISPQTQGFTIMEVSYCVNPSSPTYTNYVPASNVLQNLPAGCSRAGNSVDMTGVNQGSTVYVSLLVQLPNTSYDGPLLLLAS
jgi:hypothetical protein